MPGSDIEKGNLAKGGTSKKDTVAGVEFEVTSYTFAPGELEFNVDGVELFAEAQDTVVKSIAPGQDVVEEGTIEAHLIHGTLKMKKQLGDGDATTKG